MQWSKADRGLGLHANPNTFSTAGFQLSDFLRLLGFERQRCTFIVGGECYCKAVTEDFSLATFGQRFAQAYTELTQAERHLEACGYQLPQPEGWGFFFGKSSSPRQQPASLRGDGHAAGTVNRLKASEDQTFRFVLTWLDTGTEKGWTFHYRPIHMPTSPEVSGVFRLLGISEFAECPQFDFEPCDWRSVPSPPRSMYEHPFDDTTEYVHRYFDAHREHFSLGVEKLLLAHALMEGVGLRLLSLPDRQQRYTAEIRQRVAQPQRPAPTAARQQGSGQTFKFDVAISVAGPDRASAEVLANRIREAGFAVFYDEFFPEQLWGKDLAVFFDDVFRKQSRYCVIFVSQEYLERPWTIHERRSAVARALQERGGEYILPIKIDDVELPGLAPTVGYLPIDTGIPTIADILVRKLQSTDS